MINNSENVNQSTQTHETFENLLLGDKQIRELADEYAYTPPVPLEQNFNKVIVYAFMTARHPGVSFDVSPPDYRITAEFPSAKIVNLEKVKPVDLGLDVGEGQYLGQVKVVSIPYEEIAAKDKEFQQVQSDVLEAYLKQRQIPSPACRRWLELLPNKATEPLMPLLRKTSPNFFDAVDRCAK